MKSVVLRTYHVTDILYKNRKHILCFENASLAIDAIHISTIMDFNFVLFFLIKTCSF